MSLITLLVLILLVAVVVGLPNFGVPHNYGYGPSGVLTVVIVVILVVYLLRGYI